MKRKHIIKRARKGKVIRQVAALPYRLSPDGELEVLLLTSRGTRRFILPKGWPMKKLEDYEAAGREAAEEAGVQGRLGERPMGQFKYWKRMKKEFVNVAVDVYPLHVECELPDWKEKSERARAWVKPQHAARLVDEPALVSLLTSVCTFQSQGKARA